MESISEFTFDSKEERDLLKKYIDEKIGIDYEIEYLDGTPCAGSITVFEITLREEAELIEYMSKMGYDYD
jgi:hypothetical protein